MVKVMTSNLHCVSHENNVLLLHLSIEGSFKGEAKTRGELSVHPD